jgi:hypothetical protein
MSGRCGRLKPFSKLGKKKRHGYTVTPKHIAWYGTLCSKLDNIVTFQHVAIIITMKNLCDTVALVVTQVMGARYEGGGTVPEVRGSNHGAD